MTSDVPTLLNVNNYHYRRGGADVMYLEHSRLFTDRGWDVAEFAMHHPDNDDSEWSEHFVDEIELGSSYTPIGKVTRAGRVVYSRQSRQRLAGLLERVHPDVAHLHNIYHHISPSILPLLREHGIPVVLTTHDLKLACPSYQMLTHDGICERCKGGRLHNVVRHRCVKGSAMLSSVVFVESMVHRMLRTYLRNVDRFVTPSRFYLEKFVEWGFDRDRFVHIPNYIHPERYRPGHEPSGAVLYFGRLAPEKGVSTLVRAAALAGVPLWIAGTGPEDAAIRSLATEVGADVEMLGYLSGDALHDRVRAARATVLPSEWYENGPVSMLESYALATPVIGAKIGGITELIREGETGFGVESGSVDDLAEVLGRVAALPDHEVAEMGRAGRRWVAEDFCADRFVQRTGALYEQLGVASAATITAAGQEGITTT